MKSRLIWLRIFANPCLRRLVFGIFVILNAATARSAQTSVNSIYPEGALIQAQKDEFEESQRYEEAKAATVRFKQEYELNKEDTERDIRAKRRQIEDLKIAQESLQKDQEFLKAELVEIQNNRKRVQKRYQDLLAKFNKKTDDSDALRADIEKSKKELKRDEMSLKALEDEVTAPARPNPATINELRPAGRWTFVQNCTGLMAPDETANVIGKFQKAKFVFGRSIGEYIKVSSSTGVPIFIPIRCVKEMLPR